METMEVTMDEKNYVPEDEYNKLLNNMCEFSRKNQELEKRIVELTRENAVMAKQLNHSIILPDCRPISVARALIDMDRLFYKDGTEYEGFTKKQLRQIAEHLLVYCNEGREKKVK